MTDDARPQTEKFKEMAREVEADQSEDAFKAKVEKVARAAKPQRDRQPRE